MPVLCPASVHTDTKTHHKRHAVRNLPAVRGPNMHCSHTSSCTTDYTITVHILTRPHSQLYHETNFENCDLKRYELCELVDEGANKLQSNSQKCCSNANRHSNMKVTAAKVH